MNRRATHWHDIILLYKQEIQYDKGDKAMGTLDPKYDALFTPWKIGNVEIKNRIVMCPMGGTSLFGWMEPNHFYGRLVLMAVSLEKHAR